MTAADQIAELERQRAERHRLIDAEYDERIRRVRELFGNSGKSNHQAILDSCKPAVDN